MIPFFETVCKATLVIGAAYILNLAARRQAPSLSHLIWVLAFVCVLGLPVLTPLVKPRTIIELTVERPVSHSSSPEFVTTLSPTTGALSGARDVPKPFDEPLDRFPTSDQILVGLWVLGTIFVASRAVVGLIALCRARRELSLAFDPVAVKVDVEELASQAGAGSGWELRMATSSDHRTAMTWGIRRPIILLQMDASAWSPERLRAVLLHEFAHVRRLDFASQLLAEAACALYWFNPIVWFGARAMRLDAELAADDAVLRSGFRPSAYAAELLQIAAELGPRHPTHSSSGVLAMTSPKIESRLQSILSRSPRRRGVGSIQVLIAVGIAATSVSGIASLHVGQTGQGSRSQSEADTARNRAKMIALASMLYATDYDGLFPYAQSTSTVKRVTAPYIRDKSAFESPTPGGRFLFNKNIGGVKLSEFKLNLSVPPGTVEATTSNTPPGTVPVVPIGAETSEVAAATPMWVEQLPGGIEPAVSYVDGHCKLISASGRSQLQAALRRTFHRAKSSKPLPRS